MKFRIQFKDADAFWQGIEHAAHSYADSLDGVTFTERIMVKEDTESLLKEQLKRWIEDEEYITIEFDTEVGTACVVPAFYDFPYPDKGPESRRDDLSHGLGEGRRGCVEGEEG